MCGIAGVLHRGQIGDARERVRRMTEAIRHRGPDGEGFWANGEIALGFRRLAIVDLKSGDQPMPNEDGTVQVVFNGEIYNHADLRRELVSLGHIFRSHHCDTEVLVHGWEQWGEALLPRLNGMFAFAIWDEKSRELILARDRLGIKPLYVHETAAGHVLFGSEVRALTASGLTPRTFEAAAVIETFSFMNIWGGRTPYTGIRLLKPGTVLHFAPGRRVEAIYWRMEFERRPSRSPASEDEVFREILREAIGRQMAADVPIATYLSGGIDSTAITAIVHSIDPAARAYSCIFDLRSVGADAYVDERDFSRQAATHIGVDRIEHLIPDGALVETLPHTIASLEYGRMGMAYVNDLLARRVASDVKVVLSGLGGDETTGGYVGRYAIVPHHHGRPAMSLRRRLRQLLFHWKEAGRKADPLALYRQALNVPIGRAQIPDAFTPEFVRAARGFDPAAVIDDAIAAAPSRDPWDVVMYVDATTYLQGLLVLEDKLSMAYGLETRVPLLDNAILDYLLSVDWSLLSDGIEGKKLFRRAVAPWVPKIIANKPKMGFAPPDASWYRTSLKSFIERQLAPARIARRGVFRPKFVERVLAEHATGAANHVALIWSLLSFEAWCGQTGAFGGALP
jgi:asparagine synthase (glutamine-hydrolysing)